MTSLRYVQGLLSDFDPSVASFDLERAQGDSQIKGRTEPLKVDMGCMKLSESSGKFSSVSR
jgi:hypothetical protein